MRPEKPGAAGRSLFASILRRIIAAARLPQALASGAASVGSLWMTCGTEAGSARAAIASRSLRRCPTVGKAKVFEIISRQLGQDLRRQSRSPGTPAHSAPAPAAAAKAAMSTSVPHREVIAWRSYQSDGSETMNPSSPCAPFSHP